MSTNVELPHKVVLVDYVDVFEPVGFEAQMLAQVGASWETHQCTTSEEALAVGRDADVLVIQSVRPLFDRETIAQTTRCRCIIRAGAGYDSVDYVAAGEYGIMVCNAPTYCTEDVANHAMALLLGSLRHLPRLDAAMRRGIHDRKLSLPTRRISGSTMGIIGLGRIGRTLARRVSGWEMTVLSYDPWVSQEQADELGVEMVSLEELLERSDFISMHSPLTEETHHLLGWDEFARMKPGVIIVNTARGPLISEEALVKALEEGRVSAAGLDVTEQEPLPDDSPLLRFDNVILTPHISANTPESRHDLYRLICEISTDVVEGRIPQWVVNPEVLDHLRQVD